MARYGRVAFGGGAIGRAARRTIDQQRQRDFNPHIGLNDPMPRGWPNDIIQVVSDDSDSDTSENASGSSNTFSGRYVSSPSGYPFITKWTNNTSTFYQFQKKKYLQNQYQSALNKSFATLEDAIAFSRRESLSVFNPWKTDHSSPYCTKEDIKSKIDHFIRKNPLPSLINFRYIELPKYRKFNVPSYHGNYKTRIHVRGMKGMKNISLGSYGTIDEAIEAYNIAATYLSELQGIPYSLMEK